MVIPFLLLFFSIKSKAQRSLRSRRQYLDHLVQSIYSSSDLSLICPLDSFSSPVQVLPNENVQISGALEQYNYGENISLVCKSGKSWPIARLEGFINDKPVSELLPFFVFFILYFQTN